MHHDELVKVQHATPVFLQVDAVDRMEEGETLLFSDIGGQPEVFFMHEDVDVAHPAREVRAQGLHGAAFHYEEADAPGFKGMAVGAELADQLEILETAVVQQTVEPG